MKVYRYAFFLLLLCTVLIIEAYAGGTESVLKGRVSDVNGAAVRGALVYVYSSADVNRSAEFISAPTDREGAFSMVVPAGKYWAVARYKKAQTEEFGPLMPGDKHSGDPLEVEAAPDRASAVDFTVADLREAIRMKRAALDRPLKIRGRILDEKGAPLLNSYVIVYESGEITRFPDFLSAWVDEDGSYTLYIPEGIYVVGAAQSFPQAEDYFTVGEMTFDSDAEDRDIIRKPVENK